MKRLGSILCALVSIAVAGLIVRPLPAGESDDVHYTVVYGTAGLPVFTAKQEFDPSLLISRIKLTVAPESWASKEKSAAISGSKDHQAVVVTQTSKNHEQVRRILALLRAD